MPETRFKLPPIDDWEQFEDLCLEIWRRKWKNPSASRHGRKGQPQQGVDIAGLSQGGEGWEGVQCKVKAKGPLVRSELTSEIRKAEQFKPALARLVFATTLPRDRQDQELVRELNDSHVLAGSFPVDLFSWDDIVQEVEQHPELLRRFFPAYVKHSSPRFYGFSSRPRNTCFGRDSAIKNLHEALQLEDTVALTPPVAAYGGGGIGKTRLAFEYSMAFAREYPEGVMWVHVAEKEPKEVWNELADLRLGPGSGEERQDQETRAAEFFHYLQNLDGRLLVVMDDVTGDPQRFSGTIELGGRQVPAVPAATNLRLLLTTRFSDLPIAIPFAVSRLEKKPATELFLSYSARAAETIGVEELVSQDLGGHPLGISLAGAYLRKVGGVSVAQYRERLSQSGPTDNLEIAAKHAGHLIVDHERSIVATFKLSHDLLQSGDSVDDMAARALDFAAYFAPDVEIDHETLSLALGETGKNQDKDLFYLGLSRLEDISLLENDCKIHTLIADYVRWNQDGDTARRVCNALLKASNRSFPENVEKDIWKLLVPGGTGEYPELTPDRMSHIVNLNRLAHQLSRQGRFSPSWLLQLAASRENLGFALLKKGFFLSAKTEFVGQKTIFEELAKRNRRKPRWADGLRRSSRNIGLALNQSGKTDEFAANLKESFEYTKLQNSLRQKHKKKRNRSTSRASRVSTPPTSTDLTKATRDLEVARKNARREIEKELLGNPTLRTETTLDNAPILFQIALSLDQIGSYEDLQQAIPIFDRLTTLDPMNRDWAWRLTISLRKLAAEQRNRNEHGPALESLNRARKILEEVTGAIPDYAEWQIDLARVYLEIYRSPQIEGIDHPVPRDTVLSRGLAILEELKKEGRLSSQGDALHAILLRMSGNSR